MRTFYFKASELPGGFNEYRKQIARNEHIGVLEYIYCQHYKVHLLHMASLRQTQVQHSTAQNNVQQEHACNDTVILQDKICF